MSMLQQIRAALVEQGKAYTTSGRFFFNHWIHVWIYPEPKKSEELVYLKTKQKRVLMWKSRKNRKEKKILMKPWKSINAGWRWKSVTRESFVNEEKSFRLVHEVWKRDEWGGNHSRVGIRLPTQISWKERGSEKKQASKVKVLVYLPCCAWQPMKVLSSLVPEMNEWIHCSQICQWYFNFYENEENCFSQGLQSGDDVT